MSGRKADFIVFSAILILVFVISIILLTTPDFDFMNYQAYNCYNFLNNRFDIDYFAANARTSISPLLYLPTYFLIQKLNNHPYFFVFISILDTACLLFLLYKITALVFKDKVNKSILVVTVIFCILYAVSSPVFINLLDFSRGDCKIAVLVLLAFYIFLKNIFYEDTRKRTFIVSLAGALIGIAAALKLTAVAYFITFIAILLYYTFTAKIEKPYKLLGIFVSTFFVFFFLIDGYWLYLCCKYYHNPVFPYYNNVFKSEYADYIDFVGNCYSHILYTNMKEFLFYPFFKITQQNINTYNHFFGMEDFVWDPRYAVNYILVVFICLYLGFVRVRKTSGQIFENVNFSMVIIILIFVTISYFLNTALFGTYRYIIASSILYGVIVAVVLSEILKNKSNIIKVSISYLSVLIIICMTSKGGQLPVKYINFDDHKFNYKKISKIMEIEDAKYTDNSDVFLYEFMGSIFAVNQNKKTSFIGFYSEVANNLLNDEYIEYSRFLTDKVKTELLSDKKIYIVFPYNPLLSDEETKVMNGLKEKYNRTLTDCKSLYFKIFNTDMPFDYHKCELKKGG